MGVELGHALEVLVRLGEVALLLEDDPRAEMRVRVVRVALEDPGEELEGLVEVARRGAAAGFLGGLGLARRCRSAGRSPG